ncbi:MAG: FHA domain-containing protein [Candidatus Promineifilaceae bacterium]
MDETVLYSEESDQIRLKWEDPSTREPYQQTFPLPVTIGRSLNNHLPLNSDRVSRQHAIIEKRGEQVIIRDLESSNGTQVNQELVSEYTLADGDLVQVGPFVIEVDVAPFALPSENTEEMAFRWTNPHTGQAHHHAFVPPLTIGRGPENDLTLPGERVSRQHATVLIEDRDLVIQDHGATNGVLVNGSRLEKSVIKAGDIIQIGEFRLSLSVSAEKITAAEESGTVLDFGNKSTLIFTEEGDDLIPVEKAQAAAASLVVDRVFPPAIFDKDIVPIAELKKSGFDLDETTYLAVGGGLGSFIWVNHLVIYGVPRDQVVSIGLESKPHGRYERLCNYSQIPLYERLRSDSGSTPDNLWGWPGYAVREVWDHLKGGRILQAGKAAWQVFGEPSLAETYTPVSGKVFESIDKEARRIGWDKIWRYGHVKAIRKTDDGRYVVAYTQSSHESGRRQCLIIATYIHIAVGYPGVRFLPDLQRYREETRDFKAVVNAYENHDHVYDHLQKEGGVVLLRGRGIVASRILQHIHEIRRQNPNVAVLHLLRSPLLEGNQYGHAQRAVEHHWEFQPFNWPKACWGGDLRNVLENADDPTRDQLLNDWGGTTTADRSDWREIVNEGIREGWYQIRFGSVNHVEREEDGQLATVIKGKGQIAEEARLVADFIVDCTGLEAKIEVNPLLRDLLEHHNLGRNPKGRLQVANDFEIIGMQNSAGRMYAAGAMTLGGPYAAVDSFLGLQYSAQRSVDSLTRLRAPGLRYLNGFRSIAQWLRWARGVAP